VSHHSAKSAKQFKKSRSLSGGLLSEENYNTPIRGFQIPSPEFNSKKRSTRRAILANTENYECGTQNENFDLPELLYSLVFTQGGGGVGRVRKNIKNF
jgi:hypothetical protein